LTLSYTSMMIALTVAALGLASANNDGLLVLPRSELIHFASSPSQISLDSAGVAAVLAKVTSLPFPSTSAADVAKAHPLPSTDIFQPPSLLLFSVEGVGSEMLNDKTLNVPNLRAIMSSAEIFPLLGASTTLESSLSGNGDSNIANLLSRRHGDTPLIVCASYENKPNTFCDEHHTLVERQDKGEANIIIKSGAFNAQWNASLQNDGTMSLVDEEVSFLTQVPLSLQNIPELDAQAKDQVPDMAIISVDSIFGIGNRVAMGSPDHRRAIEALDAQLPRIIQPWQALMGPATVSAFLLAGSQQPLSTGPVRKLLATASESMYARNKARFKAEQAQYQMLLWTSIALIFAIYFVIAALFNMSYGVDDAGLYSRYKTDRDENKESKMN